MRREGRIRGGGEMPTFHGVPNHQELEARQLLQPRILLSRLSDVYVRRRRPSACVSQPSIVLVGRVPDWRRWSSLFTIPDPLHEGSSRLYAKAGPSVQAVRGDWRRAYMCVTAAYRTSSGGTVRKSALTGSTFLQRALDSIVRSVAKRLRSRSKAKS